MKIIEDDFKLLPAFESILSLSVCSPYASVDFGLSLAPKFPLKIQRQTCLFLSQGQGFVETPAAPSGTF